MARGHSQQIGRVTHASAAALLGLVARGHSQQIGRVTHASAAALLGLVARGHSQQIGRVTHASAAALPWLEARGSQSADRQGNTCVSSCSSVAGGQRSTVSRQAGAAPHTRALSARQSVRRLHAWVAGTCLSPCTTLLATARLPNPFIARARLAVPCRQIASGLASALQGQGPSAERHFCPSQPKLLNVAGWPQGLGQRLRGPSWQRRGERCQAWATGGPPGMAALAACLCGATETRLAPPT